MESPGVGCQKGFSKKGTSEQRPEGGEGPSQVKGYERALPLDGNCRAKA